MNQDLRRMAEESYEQHYKCDARDPSQAERLEVWCAAIAALAKLTQQDPLFWYRPRSDGCYEGPIHNAQIEQVRKDSGGWAPLFAGGIPSQQEERKPLTREEAYAISAPIFSGGNRYPSAELELVRAVEAAHNIKEQQ